MLEKRRLAREKHQQHDKLAGKELPVNSRQGMHRDLAAAIGLGETLGLEHNLSHGAHPPRPDIWALSNGAPANWL